MDLISQTLSYIAGNQQTFWTAVAVHVRLSGSALLLAVLIFVPLGILASSSVRLGPATVSTVGGARVVPSLAVIFLMLPLLGTGFAPALVALTILAGPPLIVNTDAGLRNIEPAIVESAEGLGMDPFQLFLRVRLPLALPVILVGLRTAAIEVIASATLAAFIGAGGLGDFILAGMTLLDPRLLLVGAVPVTVMALLAELLLGGLARLVSPPKASAIRQPTLIEA